MGDRVGGQRRWDRREMGEVLETTGDSRSKITFTMETVKNNLKRSCVWGHSEKSVLVSIIF